MSLPSRLIEERNLNQDQCRLLPHNLNFLPHAGQGKRMQQGIHLLAEAGILKQLFPQQGTIDPAIRQFKGSGKGGMQCLPARLPGIKQMAAALVQINQGGKTIAGQQAADAALPGAYATGYTKDHCHVSYVIAVMRAAAQAPFPYQARGEPSSSAARR